MKTLLSILAWLITAMTLLAQPLSSYRNPVVAGFHPDPSVCRVGDDFYLVNSSFQYFPGVPVFHSRDLVNWKQIGNVLTRDSQLPLQGATSWLGIYAPTIRYYEGTFYMISTNVGNGGNFIVSSKDPRGPWSEPRWLKQEGIDPSLFWDNGHCYMVSNPGDCIWLCEINPDTGEQLSKSKPLWKGTGGRYPEGPHIYKKDSYYYLLISEGGTELAHSLTIARSRSIEGPYEANPHNPILTNCNQKGQLKQVQGTGHGDLVQASDGSWWMVLLAYRNFGGSYHHLGRETYLAPVEWPKDGWPVVNEGEPIDTLFHLSSKKMEDNESMVATNLLDAVLNIDLSDPAWVYIQNPVFARYESFDNGVRLHAGPPLAVNKQPTFIGRRQQSPRILAEAEVTLCESSSRDEAGLSVYQIHNCWQTISLTRFGKGFAVKQEARLKSMKDVQMRMVSSDTVCLRVVSDDNIYTYQYSEDKGKTWKTVCSHDCSLLSTEVAGGFTGVVIGLYAQGSPRCYADFHHFVFRQS